MNEVTDDARFISVGIVVLSLLMNVTGHSRHLINDEIIILLWHCGDPLRVKSNSRYSLSNDGVDACIQDKASD